MKLWKRIKTCCSRRKCFTNQGLGCSLINPYCTSNSVSAPSSASRDMKWKITSESKLAMFNNICRPIMSEISNDPDYILVHVSV